VSYFIKKNQKRKINSTISRSLFIRLDSDPKCVEALLVQLSARLVSGHINDK
jgi:hypothetical protein